MVEMSRDGSAVGDGRGGEAALAEAAALDARLQDLEYELWRAAGGDEASAATDRWWTLARDAREDCGRLRQRLSEAIGGFSTA